MQRLLKAILWYYSFVISLRLICKSCTTRSYHTTHVILHSTLVINSQVDVLKICQCTKKVSEIEKWRFFYSTYLSIYCRLKRPMANYLWKYRVIIFLAQMLQQKLTGQYLSRWFIWPSCVSIRQIQLNLALVIWFAHLSTAGHRSVCKQLYTNTATLPTHYCFSVCQ